MSAKETTLDKSLDLTVFGVTGYTGRLVAAYLEQLFVAKRIPSTLRIAFAGRGVEKLKDLAKELCPTLKNSLKYLNADVADPESIYRMAGESKVVLTCVGPYEQYGEIVVKACVSCQADYVDITGEGRWVQRMKSQYDESARRNNVILIPFAGQDCVPADLCAWFATSQVNRTEMRDSHAALAVATKLPTKGSLSHGTFQTVLNWFEQGQTEQYDAPKLGTIHRLSDSVQLLSDIPPSEGGPLAFAPSRLMPDGQVIYDTHERITTDKAAHFEPVHGFVLPNRVTGYLMRGGLAVLPYLVKIPFVLPMLRGLLKSGEGVSAPGSKKAVTRDPRFYSTFGVLRLFPAKSGQSTSLPPTETVVVRLDMDRDPYDVTAITCVQIALALTDDDFRAQSQGVSLGCGFLTPVAAIGGQELLERCYECVRPQLISRM